MMGNIQFYILERAERANAEGTPAALQVQCLHACIAAALTSRMPMVYVLPLRDSAMSLIPGLLAAALAQLHVIRCDAGICGGYEGAACLAEK